MRTNPATGVYSGYYRLVESYRNAVDRVCHRTILNAGYLDELTTDQLNLIQKILTAKVANHDNPLFELPYTDDTTVIRYVEEFYQRMVAEKRIDVLVEKKDKKANRNGKDIQLIDLNSIRNKDVREVGAEWLSYQAMCQLQISPFLASLGWSEDQVRHQPGSLSGLGAGNNTVDQRKLSGVRDHRVQHRTDNQRSPV